MGTLVSIIIPVYNVEPYIRQCLESVMAQTLSEGIECIIVDDCGQDRSIQIAEEMIANYQGPIQFSIIHHEHNKGLSAARNTGIRAAKGEWLYFLDSDDWIIPECIQLMMECVDKHPNVEMVFAGAEVTTEGYDWLDYKKKQLPEYSHDVTWLQYSMLKRYDLGMTAWNKLIKKTFCFRNNLFFEEGYVHEDEIWNFTASSHIESAAFVLLNTYNYIVRTSSIITQSNEELFWERHFLLWRKMAQHINGRNEKLQVAGLCRFIMEKTRFGYPLGKRWNLFQLFCIMAWKCHSLKCVLYIIQGLLAVRNCRKYNNEKILKIIALQ